MGIFDIFKKKPASEEAPAAPATPPSNPPESQGLFARLRNALKKTTSLLNTDIRDLFKREGRLVDDGFLEELFAILIKTDMGTGPAGVIRDSVKTSFRGRIVQMEDVLANVKESLRTLVAQDDQPIKLATSGPTVILVVGVNGSGKTTSIAKLTQLFCSQGKKVILGAGDTFRAAAVEQLGIWADRLGAEIVKGQPGSDPAQRGSPRGGNGHRKRG